MNQTKDCKVLFNTLIQRPWKNEDEDPKDAPLYVITEIIKFIVKQSKRDRFFNLKDNKFCFLESAEISSNEKEPVIISGLFKSARNEFRPDLINKKTGLERKNPKEITEGDIEKTHFVIKVDENSNEVYLFLEYNFHGIHANNIVNYFSLFNSKYLTSKNKKRNYSIKHLVIPRNNFRYKLLS